MDLASITAGLATAKGGFDVLRSAIGLVRDAQGVMPEGDRKDVVGRTIEEADSQLRLAEAQIAAALGYTLCRCNFPPTPMLLAGYRLPVNGMEKAQISQLKSASGAYDVHECPRCGRNDAGDHSFTRTVPERRAAEVVTE